MKTLASFLFASILFGSILLAACGSSGSAADGGSGGHAGSAAGSAGSAGSGGSGSAGAGGTVGAGGGAGSTGGSAGGAACSTATTEAACNALTDCHAVYTAEPRTPVGTCTCPDFGCCTHFSSCASGAHANCAGTVLCKVATPYCETGYSVANDGTCYEGW